jgi:CRISPR/Cas system Type II protein with McrA/HNH and RuvC-like nuclease domain
MPIKEYWKSVYPDNGFKAKLAYLAAKKAYWRTILSERQNHRCCYCGTRMVDDNGRSKFSATVDHVTPKSKGGIDHHENYVIACYHCNNLRGDQDAYKFAQRMAEGRAHKCRGQMLKSESETAEKIALRKQLRELGISVHNSTRPCKLQNKLETFKIRQMIEQGLPNTFEPGTRAHKKYVRYSDPNCIVYERMAA